MPAITNRIATTSLAMSAELAVSGIFVSSVMSTDGRPGGNRTPNLRFWRPPLCQLSYWPALQLLLQDLGDDACADGLAALTDRKAQSIFHRDRADQLDRHLDVVPGHDHLHTRRQLDQPRDIGGAEVELRPVALEERRVTPALFLGQHVHLALEVGVRGDRAGLGQYLAALDFLALRAAQQHPDVVTRLPLVQELPEHLNPGADGLGRGLKTHDLHLIVHLHDAALDATGHHRAAPGDREHILHRHQEGLVHLALGHRDVLVHLLHQLHHRGHADVALVALERLQGRTDHDRGLLARKLVGRQQLAHFHLDQLEQLLVVHHVGLVHVHHDVRNAHLAREQNVLPGLGHRAIRRRHHQNRPVHLRRSRDHVLHVVSVSRAIHVRVVPVLALVLHVRRRNRNAARLLFRRLVDLVVRHKLSAVRLGHHLRQRRRQRRLPVVHVTNRPHVHVRLAALEFLFGHGVLPRLLTLLTSYFLMMPSAIFGGTSIYFANSIVNVARPWLMERTVVA